MLKKKKKDLKKNKKKTRKHSALNNPKSVYTLLQSLRKSVWTHLKRGSQNLNLYRFFLEDI